MVRTVERKAPCQQSLARRAFTLVELMIAMVIILILIGLLIPAVSSVQTNAKNAKVRVEIESLAKGVSDFKSAFGNVEPPSSITLYEAAAAGPTGSWDSRSAALIRRMFPNFNFGLARDINNDGDTTDTFTLTGAECLVFFLGGPLVGEEDANANGVLDVGEDLNGNGKLDGGQPFGFAKNPANPFLLGADASGDGIIQPAEIDKGTRLGPFVEFEASRLIDIDGDFMKEFCDSLPNAVVPYVYVSSYGGRGYEVGDLSLNTTSTPSLTSVYMQGTLPFNAKSFQIISPGYDRVFGSGGFVEPGNDIPSRGVTIQGRDASEFESDNISNFYSKTLN
ncbi:MAG: hypothetical protein CMJ78_15910 [Planctomycetaceae bacterium]|nr:hypothetical protein [Planctomycetaceae bacterium]